MSKPARHIVRKSFAAWLSGFRERAGGQHIHPGVLDHALSGLAPDDEVLRRLDAQPENVLSLARYMQATMPPERIRRGRAAMRRHRALLADIEETYRVDAAIVVAIWAVESDLGRIMGDFEVIRSLATLAWASRRALFFEGELVSALRMVQIGAAPARDFTGSWAGASGHGQFMPSSYLEFAVDHDGDGRADIWGKDPADGLASIAHYLSGHFWNIGQPRGCEVILPEGFDYAQSGPDRIQPVSDWIGAGLRGRSGEVPGNYGNATLLLPAGHRGPAFLAYRNFFVLTRYNAATRYALAVGHLADRLTGDGTQEPDWPDEPPLTRDQIAKVQAGLALLGHDPGEADGLMGPATQAALRDWQQEVGLPADGYPDREILRRLSG